MICRTQSLFLSALAAALLCLSTGSAGAYDGENWTMGGQWMSFHYEEPGVMKEDGNLFGVKFDHWARYDGWDLLSSIELVFGTVHYDGAVILENGNTVPIQLDSDDIIFNTRTHATWWFEEPVTNDMRLGAYAGLGPEGALRLAVFATHTEPMIRQLLDELRRLV